MKVVTSNCERKFLSTICGRNGPGIRLDGRGQLDGRTLEITFLQEDGCVANLGNTKVLAQVSCDISQPKPCGGLLQVYVELSSMGDPNFESSKMTGVENARLIQRFIRDSKCFDLESLCGKACNIRLYISVLNYDGNVLECSTIAAVAALQHFRNPVDINFHHIPIMVTMAVYNEGESLLMDPVEIEERFAEGLVVLCVNSHQEVCLTHLSGGLLTREKILQCMDLAVRRGQVVTPEIKAIDNNLCNKNIKEPVSFVSLLNVSTTLGAKRHIVQTI